MQLRIPLGLKPLFALALVAFCACATGDKPVRGSGIEFGYAVSKSCQGDLALHCYERGLKLATNADTVSKRSEGVALISQACGAKVPGACETLNVRFKRPERLSGRSPEYTREALMDQMTGKIAIKCILTGEGKLRACQVLPPRTIKEQEILQWSKMQEEILNALSGWQFAPATFDGRPCEIDYLAKVNLRLQP